MFIPKAPCTPRRRPARTRARGAPRKKGVRLPGMVEWAQDASRPWSTQTFHQFGLHAVLQVKTQQALYYKAGGSRLLTIVLTRDRDGKRPDPMFYCTKLDWPAAANPGNLCLPLGHRMHLGKQQTVLGTGRPCQPLGQGGRANGADGLVAVHTGRRLVPRQRPPLPTLSPSPLVSTQEGTLLCRSVDHVATPQLRGENRAAASQAVSLENLARPNHRASQPHGLSRSDPGAFR